MALRYRSRRGWSLAILLFGLPLYVVVAVTVIGWFDRLGFLAELALYLCLGRALGDSVPIRVSGYRKIRSEQEPDRMSLSIPQGSAHARPALAIRTQVVIRSLTA